MVMKSKSLIFSQSIASSIVYHLKFLFIFSYKKEKKQSEENGGDGVKLRVSMAPSTVRGNVKTTTQQSLFANMKIKVKMEQADMPGGLSNLLQLTTNNLQIESENEQSFEKEQREEAENDKQ